MSVKGYLNIQQKICIFQLAFKLSDLNQAKKNIEMASQSNPKCF